MGLVVTLYPNLRYISLDEVEARLQLQAMPTRAWATAVGHAILDEAQKARALFDKFKFAYDSHDIDFSVLLGSSQILMMNRVRETLAGRVFIYERWPLLLTELLAGSTTVQAPLFAHLLQSERAADAFFAEIPPILIGDEAWQHQQWFDYALHGDGNAAAAHHHHLTHRFAQPKQRSILDQRLQHAVGIHRAGHGDPKDCIQHLV